MVVTSSIDRTAPRAQRFTLALVFLAVRLLAALLPMPSVAQPAPAAHSSRVLLPDQVICHAEAPASGIPDHAPLDHPAGHDHDCGLCPICHLMAASALLAAKPPDLPAYVPPPRARHGFPPPATGPPALARGAANPRGPPTLSV